ncbi:hypothetical protein DPEC_G00017730 [Dallia pectoralis]|uniref:Uncharacterized protein n=1 Tax=Dallia pectoralis TaxID=75939 RepID=A0ACC2HG00_DALPE|nr:hypothetical protein DPEC_G00017730 [Dallia pectoralis]
MIESCPLPACGQTRLFSGQQTCSCGFHQPKLTSGPAYAPAASPGTAPTTSGAPASPQHNVNLSMLTKPQFGGSPGAAAKLNMNMVKKVVQRFPALPL